MAMLRLAVVGATGRVGRVTLEAALLDERFEVVAALSTVDDPLCGQALRIGSQDVAITADLIVACDVLIDFSNANGTMSWLKMCLDGGIAMVVGATGHNDSQLSKLREAAQKIPILVAPNCSAGVAALLGLVSKLAGVLGDDYDIEIVETHHHHKEDAPSGTALALRDALLNAGEGTCDVVYGREGKVGARPRGQVGIHAVRMGDIVGRHEIHFSGCGETITLRHEAHSRHAFAIGALRGAAWIAGKSPGWYSMADVLG